MPRYYFVLKGRHRDENLGAKNLSNDDAVAHVTRAIDPSTYHKSLTINAKDKHGRVVCSLLFDPERELNDGRHANRRARPLRRIILSRCAPPP
jgi:hypothetical protein